MDFYFELSVPTHNEAVEGVCPNGKNGTVPLLKRAY